MSNHRLDEFLPNDQKRKIPPPEDPSYSGDPKHEQELLIDLVNAVKIKLSRRKRSFTLRFEFSKSTPGLWSKGHSYSFPWDIWKFCYPRVLKMMEKRGWKETDEEQDLIPVDPESLDPADL